MQEELQAGLSRFIAQCDFDRIDEHFKADARLRVLDWLGCAVAGAHYPQMQLGLAMLGGAGGAPEASIVGLSTKLPARSAAYLNGIAGHVCELDDGHRTAIGHAGSVTVPVALTLAEKTHCTGAEFLKAVILGYDMFARVGRMVNPTHYRYWHTTGTVGTLAATAAASSILKLDAEQVNNALGIACTSAGGLVESFGTHAKAINIALACQNGVDAATLASLGMTGSHSALMGKKGFTAATCTDPHPDNLLNPSENSLVSDTAFFKKYSSCGHTNSPLDGLVSLMEQHPDIKPENVSSVTVRTYKISVEITSELKCATEDEAKFSLPYCFAVQIAFGRVGLKQFEQSVRSDERILNLARKVSVVESQEATEAFPKRIAEVEVHLTDGRVYTEKRLGASDEASEELIKTKFRETVAFMPQDAVEAVLKAVEHIDSLPTVDPLVEFLTVV